jgi:hypothetical protein
MNFNEYKNTFDYPIKSEFTTVFYTKHGELIAKKTGETVVYTPGTANIPLNSCTTEFVIDHEGFKQARLAYGQETQRLTQKFYADIKADLGIENHPKADKLIAYAWEQSHSSGFEEVYNTACELVDLIV